MWWLIDVLNELHFYPAFVVAPHIQPGPLNEKTRGMMNGNVGVSEGWEPKYLTHLQRVPPSFSAQYIQRHSWARAHICSTWSLWGPMVNHRGRQQLHCHQCLKTHSDTPNSFYTLCMLCVLQDTTETVIMCLCLVDSTKRVMPAHWYNSPYLMMSVRCLCACMLIFFRR